MEGGVTEGEDAPVGGDQPVAPAVGCGRHSHHRSIEGETTGRTVEGGVTEGEDAPVSGNVQVPLPVGGRRHPHDGLVEMTGGGLRQDTGQLRILMEHRPRPLPERVTARSGDFIVLDDALVVGTVSGDGDADAPVGIDGHHRGVLEPDRPGTQGGHHRGAATVINYEAGRGRDQDIVIAGSGQVGGRDPTDDPARGRLRPSGQWCTVRPVEYPHGSTRSGVGPLDHFHRAVTSHVTDGRAVNRVAAQVGLPHDVAMGIRSEHRVGVGCPRKVRTGSEGDTGRASGQETPHRRRRVDRLVHMVIADEVATSAQNPKVTTVGIGDPIGHTGAGVTSLNNFGLSVAVQVGQRRCGEPAVRGEERPSREHRPVHRVHGVLVLAERRRGHPGDPVDVPHRHGGLNSLRPLRIGGVHAPHLRSRMVEGGVTAHVRIWRVPGADVHRVQTTPVDRSGRGCRIDRHTPGVSRPSRRCRSISEVERPQCAGSVTDHHRGTGTVEGGH